MPTVAVAGRPSRTRDTYTRDATYLTRLAQAIEVDTRHSPKWRKDCTGLIQQLVALLLLPELATDD